MRYQMFNDYWQSTITITKSLFRHWRLLLELSKRELTEQHAGQMFGTTWIIVHPLCLMAIYLFVFGFVFSARVGGTYEMPLDYTTYILAGLIPWLTLQQNLSKACNAIINNAGLVKQVVFPTEILPVKVMMSTLIWYFISLLILILYVLITHGSLSPFYLLIPVLMLLQFILMMGLSFIVSAVCVYVRDVRELIALFCMAGVFLLPIAYLPKWVPSIFKPLLYINPFSYLVWCYQDVLYFGRFEHPWSWIVLLVGSLLTFALGSRVFRTLKQWFGEAL